MRHPECHSVTYHSVSGLFLSPADSLYMKTRRLFQSGHTAPSYGQGSRCHFVPQLLQGCPVIELQLSQGSLPSRTHGFLLQVEQDSECHGWSTEAMATCGFYLFWLLPTVFPTAKQPNIQKRTQWKTASFPFPTHLQCLPRVTKGSRSSNLYCIPHAS